MKRYLLLFTIILAGINVYAQSIACEGIAIHNYPTNDERLLNISKAFKSVLTDFSDCKVISKEKSAAHRVVFNEEYKESEFFNILSGGRGDSIKKVLFLEFKLIKEDWVQVTAEIRNRYNLVDNYDYISLDLADFREEITSSGRREIQKFVEKLLRKKGLCETKFDSDKTFNILITLFNLPSRCPKMESPEIIVQEELISLFKADGVEVVLDCRYDYPVYNEKDAYERAEIVEKVDMVLWGEYRIKCNQQEEISYNYNLMQEPTKSFIRQVGKSGRSLPRMAIANSFEGKLGPIVYWNIVDKCLKNIKDNIEAQENEKTALKYLRKIDEATNEQDFIQRATINYKFADLHYSKIASKNQLKECANYYNKGFSYDNTTEYAKRKEWIQRLEILQYLHTDRKELYTVISEEIAQQAKDLMLLLDRIIIPTNKEDLLFLLRMAKLVDVSYSNQVSKILASADQSKDKVVLLALYDFRVVVTKQYDIVLNAKIKKISGAESFENDWDVWHNKEDVNKKEYLLNNIFTHQKENPTWHLILARFYSQTKEKDLGLFHFASACVLDSENKAYLEEVKILDFLGFLRNRPISPEPVPSPNHIHYVGEDREFKNLVSELKKLNSELAKEVKARYPNEYNNNSIVGTKDKIVLYTGEKALRHLVRPDEGLSEIVDGSNDLKTHHDHDGYEKFINTKKHNINIKSIRQLNKLNGNCRTYHPNTYLLIKRGVNTIIKAIDEPISLDMAAKKFKISRKELLKMNGLPGAQLNKCLWITKN